MRPRPPLSPVVLALAVFFLLPNTARAFELQKHSAMTWEVLGRHGLSGPALALVAYGAMLPDVQNCLDACYCDFAPEFCQPGGGQIPQYAVNHFDNNLLDESAARANALMDQARAGISTVTGDSRASALTLIAFGKALHTMQDFYAHSTFVEINLFPGPGITTNINNIPTWQGQPYALYSWSNDNTSGSGDLQTGFYIAATPPGGYSHTQLNKDKPSSPEGEQIARVSGVPPLTNLYGVASGDFTNSGSYTDLGLAPRHTIAGYAALLSGGLLFPYQPVSLAPAGPARADYPRLALDFFEWVNQDPTLIAMAAAAESLMAHVQADSIGSFPAAAVDSEWLPRPIVVGVGPTLPAPSRWLSAARPNPTRGATNFAFTTPVAGTARLAIYDLEGRRVARLYDGEATPGVHECVWDGRDERGSRVPPGVYLARYTGPGGSESRRFAVMR